MNTCMYPKAEDRPASGIIDECVWSEVKDHPVGHFEFYAKSKLLAEKAAWQF